MKNWIKSKKQLIKENKDLKEFLKLQIHKLRELDRSKIYVLKLERDKMMKAEAMLEELDKRIFLPEIIVTDLEFEEKKDDKNK